jgi:hypothetical protein
MGSRRKFQNSKIVPAYIDTELGDTVGCWSFLIIYSVPTRHFPRRYLNMMLLRNREEGKLFTSQQTLHRQ